MTGVGPPISVKNSEWWKLSDEGKRMWKIEWWVMSYEWWVMSDERWKLSDYFLLAKQAPRVFNLQKIPKLGNWPLIFWFPLKSRASIFLRFTKSYGMVPCKALRRRSSFVRLVRLNNHRGMEELNWLYDKSRTERELKLTNGRERGRLSSSQEDKCNSRREGSVLTACNQSAPTPLKFTPVISRYFKEERLDNQSIFLEESGEK